MRGGRGEVMEGPFCHVRKYGPLPKGSGDSEGLQLGHHIVT